jgi:hypothetical protein
VTWRDSNATSGTRRDGSTGSHARSRRQGPTSCSRILKRQNENLALAFVAARIMECVLIGVGILSVLSVVTLRQDFAGSTSADATALATVGQALVALHDWTFNLGPGFVVGVGNGLILGYLTYRSGLVPRGMAVLGLIGGRLICLSGVAVMFGIIQPVLRHC